MPDVMPDVMPETKQTRFFIAIMLPEEIEAYATEVSHDLRKRYSMRTAKAAPHITLFPPFLWPLELVDQVRGAIATFANTQPSIPIQVTGFGCFAPRVLYLNVVKTDGLMTLQSNLGNHLNSAIGLDNPEKRFRSYSPHITVASRNVKRSTFNAAWQDLKEQSVDFTFTCNAITLLVYDTQWNIDQTFEFQQ